MSKDSADDVLLPKELMELQLGQVDLLMAMYASDEAISIDDSSSALLETLKAWCEDDDNSESTVSGTVIALVLSLDIEDEDDTSSAGAASLQLDLSVPVRYTITDGAEEVTEPPKINIRVLQPAWMNKAEAVRLTESIPDEDVLTAIEHVKEAASTQLSESRRASTKTDSLEANADLVRIWFYFPSISTRSKRDDIVNYAPGYGLTGFLLAGKPGVLCLEGDAETIYKYMNFIKTESWSDIPSQHKKVSERYRETGADVKRAFSGMTEITDDLGERRGTRANRNDMKALEAYLTENGVGGAFAELLL